MTGSRALPLGIPEGVAQRQDGAHQVGVARPFAHAVDEVFIYASWPASRSPSAPTSSRDGHAQVVVADRLDRQADGSASLANRSQTAQGVSPIVSQYRILAAPASRAARRTRSVLVVGPRAVLRVDPDPLRAGARPPPPRSSR